jgi:predicted nucleotidyltransferase
MQEKIIVNMIFGSHLYGTNTSDSDADYKGIFLPTKEQIYLGNIPKCYDSGTKKTRKGQKNIASDIDTEIYSLHYFIKLACEGQTVAMDMLHAPDNMIIESTSLWETIVANREKFYTKKLQAFVGYARKQAAKYGIKGSRIDVIKQTIDILNKYIITGKKLEDIWYALPIGDHSEFIDDTPNGVKQYRICGKIMQSSMAITYAQDILNRYMKNYGDRANKAANNEGIDWKAVSHALRAAFQVKQLLTEGTITFPLKEASYILQIKKGELNYLTQVAPHLEELMNEVEELSVNSAFPAKVNRKFWNDFIISAIDNSF